MRSKSRRRAIGIGSSTKPVIELTYCPNRSAVIWHLLCRYLPNRKWRLSHGTPDSIRRAVWT